jgi:hypothetical protein
VEYLKSRRLDPITGNPTNSSPRQERTLPPDAAQVSLSTTARTRWQNSRRVSTRLTGNYPTEREHHYWLIAFEGVVGV